jgi:deoxyinosine 3'endonuclease (endonuclease V)
MNIRIHQSYMITIDRSINQSIKTRRLNCRVVRGLVVSYRKEMESREVAAVVGYQYESPATTYPRISHLPRFH